MKSSPASSGPGNGAPSTFWRDVREGFIHICLILCALVSILTTVGIVAILLVESLQFFQDVSLAEFLTDTKWSPLLRPQRFGILPLFCGTMMVAIGSAILAVPVGLGAAVYLAEYAPKSFRETVKPMLEILAGIPSVVYGYFGIITVSPAIRWFCDLPGIRSLAPEPSVFNAASACIVVGIMILPTVISLSEDVIRSVPRALRESAFALGATKFDVSVRVILPAAMSGIVAAVLLAIGRAIGETMAVTLAAGATPKLTINPLESIQTMTAYIVQVSQGDAPAGTVEYRSIFAVGLTLFVVTVCVNLAAQGILARMREKYE